MESKRNESSRIQPANAWIGYHNATLGWCELSLRGVFPLEYLAFRMRMGGFIRLRTVICGRKYAKLLALPEVFRVTLTKTSTESIFS
jgi:hypothetical protein